MTPATTKAPAARAADPARASIPAGLPPALVAAMVIVAFAARAALFGDPRIDVDENFYLLVGDRMLHGAIPYVDIWDRKPIGLFLIYAGIRALGGAGIVQYQIVATLFAAATAIVLARVARHMAPPLAAAAAGILYLLLLPLAGGGGGQSPVFYNLPVAGAALLVLRCFLDPDPNMLRRRGAAAMLLVGLAMQIKYTAVFEGLFFGVALLTRSWRIGGGYRRTLADGALWVALALAPTLAALGGYALLGWTRAFVFANFLSIAGRAGASGAEALHRLARTGLVLLAPLAGVALAFAFGPWRETIAGRVAFRFTLSWGAAAIAGYLVFGTYFDHYALPLFAPIATGCAPLFAVRRRRAGAIIAALALGAGVVADQVAARRIERHFGTARQTEAIVDAIRARHRGGLYVFKGDTIFYLLTASPPPTRYPFAEHLLLQREAGAVGIDPLAEIARVIATRPAIVLETLGKDEAKYDARALGLGRARLAEGYRPFATLPIGKSRVVLYERRCGAPASLRAREPSCR